MEIARLEAGAADLDLRPELPELALDEAMGALKSEAGPEDVTMVIAPEGRIRR